MKLLKHKGSIYVKIADNGGDANAIFKTLAHLIKETNLSNPVFKPISDVKKRRQILSLLNIISTYVYKLVDKYEIE